MRTMKNHTSLVFSILLCISILYFATNIKAGNPSIHQNASVAKRFDLPAGFHKVKVTPGSFAEYLRNLPLKPEGATLYYYNHQIKKLKYDGGVVDCDFGNNYAEQCADAVIYLRANWLWKTKQYDKIHFNFNNGFKADYAKWAKGYRIHVNKKTWACNYFKRGKEDYSYETFRKYLDIVFEYAGTASLTKELKSISFSDLHIGDVLINGGYPGHAVIIVDEAVNNKGKKLFLIAQGYTPAQEIEIYNKWFSVDSTPFYFPYWTFKGTFTKRFK